MCSVETVILLRQVGMDLYVGRKVGEADMIYVPVNPTSVFTQMVDSRKTIIVNDAAKDRQTMSEVRQAFNFGLQ